MPPAMSTKLRSGSGTPVVVMTCGVVVVAASVVVVPTSDRSGSTCGGNSVSLALAAAIAVGSSKSMPASSACLIAMSRAAKSVPRVATCKAFLARPTSVPRLANSVSKGARSDAAQPTSRAAASAILKSESPILRIASRSKSMDSTFARSRCCTWPASERSRPSSSSFARAPTATGESSGSSSGTAQTSCLRPDLAARNAISNLPSATAAAAVRNSVKSCNWNTPTT
mmetsp:Transcript_108745/g.347074  ORF Transcript_108745/g.347074 Transcript_108745/m.347074 type:complete len:227 (+) Transcript_108745:193-873(+)